MSNSEYLVQDSEEMTLIIASAFNLKSEHIKTGREQKILINLCTNEDELKELINESS